MTAPAQPDRVEVVQADLSWIDIATNGSDVWIIAASSGWAEQGFFLETHWEDNFQKDAPQLTPGAYRWTGFKLSSWDEGELMNVVGGDFNNHRIATAAEIEQIRQESEDCLNEARSHFEMANNARLAAEAEIARLREALRELRGWLTCAPLESGYCCCGSPVKGHGFGDGHSPVDELAYSAQGQVELIDAALADVPSPEVERG